MARKHSRNDSLASNTIHTHTTSQSDIFSYQQDNHQVQSAFSTTTSDVLTSISKQLAELKPLAWKLDWISPNGETFTISNNHPASNHANQQDNTAVQTSKFSAPEIKPAYIHPTPPPSESGSFHALGERKRSISNAQRKDSTSKRSRGDRESISLPDQKVKSESSEETESENDDEEEDGDEFRGVAKQLVDVKIDNMRPYYVILFKMLQQRGCKKIAQAWIKKGEPRKQGVHPYNGGTNAKSYPDFDPKNPGKHTAPPYWPHQDDWANPKTTGARHKEPDHSKVYERLNVLCWLLRLGSRCDGYSFDVDLLEESTKDIMSMHPGHFRDDAPSILGDIYRARRVEEQWELGRISGETTIPLSLPITLKGDRTKLSSATKKKKSVIKKDACADSRQDLSMSNMTSDAEAASLAASTKPDQFHRRQSSKTVSVAPIDHSHSSTQPHSRIYEPITPPNEMETASKLAAGTISPPMPSSCFGMENALYISKAQQKPAAPCVIVPKQEIFHCAGADHSVPSSSNHTPHGSSFGSIEDGFSPLTPQSQGGFEAFVPTHSTQPSQSLVMQSQPGTKLLESPFYDPWSALQESRNLRSNAIEAAFVEVPTSSTGTTTPAVSTYNSFVGTATTVSSSPSNDAHAAHDANNANNAISFPDRSSASNTESEWFSGQGSWYTGSFDTPVTGNAVADVDLEPQFSRRHSFDPHDTSREASPGSLFPHDWQPLPIGDFVTI